MINLGKGAARNVKDYRLSRYACYIIAQNGDPHKKPVALAQSYFAIKTRQQELISNYTELSEDERRLQVRKEMKQRNTSLYAEAQRAGIQTEKDYAIFTDNGYRGLYGGLSHKNIKNKKGLSKNQRILDHMGSTELAANIFRATQAAEKLAREQVHDKADANKIHHTVGAKIRQTMQDLGNTMPENLPTPAKSIKQLESEHNARKSLHLVDILEDDS